MGPVWALMLMLHITQGAEAVCDVTQDNALCYGALGGIIEIRMMASGSTTPRFIWRNSSGSTIFDWRNNITRITLSGRYEFNPSTGIFQIHNLSKDDADSYTLELYDKDGIGIKTSHELIIEAPVSSVNLQHQCLSEGEMRVSCSAEGDSPEFSWTLNGENLTDSQLLSKNDENNIILRQNTEGLLRCSVRNHVSQIHQELRVSSCGYILINCTVNGTQIIKWVFKENNTQCIEQTTSEPITVVGKTPSTIQSTPTSYTSGPWYIQNWPILVGALTGIVIIGLAAIVLAFVLKKKCKKAEDEEHELTYADVRILQQPGRTPPQRQPEMEVEYGQVRFSNQNQNQIRNQNQPVSETADACIYAKVRR